MPYILRKICFLGPIIGPVLVIIQSCWLRQHFRPMPFAQTLSKNRNWVTLGLTSDYMLTGDCRYDSTKLKFQRSCISASVRYSWYENKDTYTDKHTYIHTYKYTYTNTYNQYSCCIWTTTTLLNVQIEQVISRNIWNIKTIIIWNKIFENGPSKICGRQPLKKLAAIWSA